MTDSDLLETLCLLTEEDAASGMEKKRMKKNNIELRKILCESRVIQYQLTRKSVKNINLRIKSDGLISVSANYLVPTDVIDQFVKKNQEKIIRILEKIESNKEHRVSAEKKYQSGEEFRFLGRTLILKVVQGEQDSIAADDAFLYLTVKKERNQKQNETFIINWMKEMQIKIFHQICREIHQKFIIYDIDYPLVKIRTMKSRWGSCQPKRGIITLNSKLIEVPRDSIEYVVLHEFAHFMHPDHSRQFYDFVEKLMPDWKKRRDGLSQ